MLKRLCQLSHFKKFLRPFNFIRRIFPKSLSTHFESSLSDHPSISTHKVQLDNRNIIHTAIRRGSHPKAKSQFSAYCGPSQRMEHVTGRSIILRVTAGQKLVVEHTNLRGSKTHRVQSLICPLHHFRSLLREDVSLSKTILALIMGARFIFHSTVYRQR